MMSSDRMDWETPGDLFDRLHQEFNFNLDVCALPHNSKCEQFFSPSDDGLNQDWNGVCWMNPPYGREIGKWIQKAYEESLRGSKVVCLIPARTDTKYWHDYVMQASEIRLIKGRVRFVGAEHSAPFPSAIVIFGHGDELKVSGYTLS
jgi:phage N-6-adenine-methyltransferase